MDLPTTAEGPRTMPLTDIRVIDFSTLLPGPMCSLLLAQGGAEVIKIERPGRRDGMRSYDGGHAAEMPALPLPIAAAFRRTGGSAPALGEGNATLLPPLGL